ncbi:tRNA (guanosine(37)-N1)-methyltransferase TrmD [Phosphitispora sp. TUW77]|uniref:tRNA (guanosine(37)-N1)-methyltransferase TrmD n=1 Tax=Phosphitispora sp. TUW77 TaxID=3152361 RepID=UPI003AB5B6ED
MKIDILTLFPEMFMGPFDNSIIKRAREKGMLEIHLTNIRDFAFDKHKIVDDYPFGGGSGMVMKPDPVFTAVEHVKKNDKEKLSRVILLCPQGRVFKQETAKRLSGEAHLILICGHYEGIDERVREMIVDEEISIGDFVLTGGEIPAMVMVDAISRLIPGVLGDEDSYVNDSFYNGILEHPQYTRPREYKGIQVPEVLLSGNHEKIRQWRRKKSLQRTMQRRPDLLKREDLSPEDSKLLEQTEED